MRGALLKVSFTRCDVEAPVEKTVQVRGGSGDKQTNSYLFIHKTWVNFPLIPPLSTNLCSRMKTCIKERMLDTYTGTKCWYDKDHTEGVCGWGGEYVSGSPSRYL